MWIGVNRTIKRILIQWYRNFGIFVTNDHQQINLRIIFYGLYFQENIKNSTNLQSQAKTQKPGYSL
jgi:hypothetical protein